MTKISQKELKSAKELGKYAGQWVAFKVKERHVAAAGKTLREVKEIADKKKLRGHAFHFVPSKPLIMHEM
jgi:hypothetical protein